MQELELCFSDFWLFMSFRKCPSKTEYTKISAKSFRFDSSNHFENELISDMSEQGSLDIWLETNCLTNQLETISLFLQR